GRQEYLKRAEDALAAIKVKLPEYFGRLPKADLVVRRVEPFREVAGGAQHYQRGTPDGSRPGIFYVHLKDMNQEPTYQLADVAYHEGLPGHHMQLHQSWAGDMLQDRHDQAAAAARQGKGGARRQVLLPRLPRCRAGRRRLAVAGPRAARESLDRDVTLALQVRSSWVQETSSWVAVERWCPLPKST